MKKIKLFIIILLGVAAVSLILSNVRLRAQENFMTKMIDQRFPFYFSALCEQIHSVENGANAQRAYGNICWDLFEYTSYADNENLEALVLQVCQWGEMGKLDDYLDRDLSEKLGRLCQRLSSYGRGPWTQDSDRDTEELIQEINNIIQNKVKE